jgi:hypothetical protein
MLKTRFDSVWIDRFGEGDGGAQERESSGDDPSGDEGADAVKASEHGDSSCKWALACDPSETRLTRDPLKG